MPQTGSTCLECTAVNAPVAPTVVSGFIGGLRSRSAKALAGRLSGPAEAGHYQRVDFSHVLQPDKRGPGTSPGFFCWKLPLAHFPVDTTILSSVMSAFSTVISSGAIAGGVGDRLVALTNMPPVTPPATPPEPPCTDRPGDSDDIPAVTRYLPGKMPPIWNRPFSYVSPVAGVGEPPCFGSIISMTIAPASGEPVSSTRTPET